ncbi:hypothetical protein Z950_635 [Sulfitobacter mediterraneus KCTC 32188]|nr:hypothetical protein Z950_635 [Sulfitobacter mediterraneus KCTC 32188]
MPLLVAQRVCPAGIDWPLAILNSGNANAFPLPQGAERAL